ncbi:hypothetical protein ACTMSW_29485 [Micromonospora sp. BQ11]
MLRQLHEVVAEFGEATEGGGGLIDDGGGVGSSSGVCGDSYREASA